MRLLGIHHVSALTAHAADNVRFYTETLGLRLVKKTVNQDDTSSYHLFYGDELGHPGTELTFFDIPQAARTLPGSRSISSVGLRVPTRDSLLYWQNRLQEIGLDVDAPSQRAGRAALGFRDFEGQHLVLVADDGEDGVPGGKPWQGGPVPQHAAIYGLGPVTLVVQDSRGTKRVLTDVLGFTEKGIYPSPASEEPPFHVFSTGDGGSGAEVHVQERPELAPERLGRGGVHHVAFRVPNMEEYEAWLGRLDEAGLRTSGPVDRFYFKSIYFREPSGILFELATDGPGFATDEDPQHLGERLSLPPFLEPHRAQIEANLHPLNV